METYSVNLEASQIVRWLIEEQRRGTLQLTLPPPVLTSLRRWKGLIWTRSAKRGRI